MGCKQELDHAYRDARRVEATRDDRTGEVTGRWQARCGHWFDLSQAYTREELLRLNGW